MKILSVGAELVHENTEVGQRRKDLHYDTNVCSSQFCERSY
jgi:hypothetical protein